MTPALNDLLAELERLALAAQSRPWSSLPLEESMYDDIRIAEGGRPFAKVWQDDAPVEDFNSAQRARAKYIVAAQPDIILSLISLIRAEMERVKVKALEEAFTRGAREGWMRAYVYAVNIDAEADDGIIAQMNSRWPLKTQKEEGQ